MGTLVITKDGEKGRVVGNDGEKALVFIDWADGQRSQSWFPWDELHIVGEELEPFDEYSWKERLLKEYYT